MTESHNTLERIYHVVIDLSLVFIAIFKRHVGLFHGRQYSMVEGAGVPRKNTRSRKENLKSLLIKFAVD